MPMPKEQAAPSFWVVRFASLIVPGGPVLDLACGSGRHADVFLERGHPVTAVDRDISRLMAPATAVTADLEADPWPFAGAAFAGVVVTNYLHRPLFPEIIAALAPGGVLIYETFAEGNERHGRPSNPDFLLRHGELLEIATMGGLRVFAYEDLEVSGPQPACVQRLCACQISR
ncbi:MAG: class I SAM-dependent methyltransferase [Alphaproteobacteria bacterium]|nr:class I SAM-dependent methyltransferase [Alphaproteobacteria bacterium]MDP6237603.1 class I SAM-dependent methyltransferase [Alphaproteobacteria bacterium]MDP7172810.1 class I SAM-dependent methyltransferase [Alphaproteobacteria bacterium]MDP7232580.1 class I SAM-dependent methyltransferase [Alphaproteobacteria bacterium]MDP7487191.1 class I SAM-dependent methyltransferase [Alphaproteobacteria bacterium]